MASALSRVPIRIFVGRDTSDMFVFHDIWKCENELGSAG